MREYGQITDIVLNNKQKQVIYSGILGDGCLLNSSIKRQTAAISYSCIFEEYIDFKKSILDNLANKVKFKENSGYKKGIIYTVSTFYSREIYNIGRMSLKELVYSLDDLGIALWIYDDGSLHKKSKFYNLNTHAFSEDIQREIFIPFFNSKGIFPTIAYDRKKDGRSFTYLRINKTKGADTLSTLLKNYPINCFNYKIWQ